jgi:hypothetical protein
VVWAFIDQRTPSPPPFAMMPDETPDIRLFFFFFLCVCPSLSLWPLTLNMCVQQTPKSIDPFRKSVQVAERLPPPHTLFNARLS